MYISIRHYKEVESPKDVTAAVNEKFFPLVSKVPGFLVYYGIETGDHSWASVNIFESPEGAKESTKLGLNLAKDVGITSAPEIIAATLVSATAIDDVDKVMREFAKSL